MSKKSWNVPDVDKEHKGDGEKATRRGTGIVNEAEMRGNIWAKKKIYIQYWKSDSEGGRGSTDWPTSVT